MNATIRTLRIIRWVAIGLAVLSGLGVAALELLPRPDAAVATAGASVAGGLSIGGPFHLTDEAGQPVTDATYRGRWMLVFFGYTNCPDECPLTLQKMAAALGKLGPADARKVAPLFITVDPARDTPARLRSYLANFDPRIVGLTGSDAQIAAAANAYRVYYSATEHEKSGADIVGQSTFLYLMEPSGGFNKLFPSDTSADTLAAILRAKVAAKS